VIRHADAPIIVQPSRRRTQQQRQKQQRAVAQQVDFPAALSQPAEQCSPLLGIVAGKHKQITAVQTVDKIQPVRFTPGKKFTGALRRNLGNDDRQIMLAARFSFVKNHLSVFAES